MVLTFNIFIEKLIEIIDNSNTKIIDSVTNADTKYELSCVKPDLTYMEYFKILKSQWDPLMNQLVNDVDICEQATKFAGIMSSTADLKLNNFFPTNFNSFATQNLKSMVINNFPNNEEIKNIIIKIMSNTIIPKTIDFTLNENPILTLTNLLKILSSKSVCWFWDIIIYIVSSKYKQMSNVKNMSKDELTQIIHDDIQEFFTKFNNISSDNLSLNYSSIISNISDKITSMHTISIESQLDNLIPNKVGAMKNFFITIISAYYKNLHPIIWTQILKQILISFKDEVPLTEDALFQFVSKHLLLNSGPFILKILQQIRPNLSSELLTKYNLHKLKYPLMTSTQSDLILKKVVKNWSLYKINGIASASVGQVFFVRRIDSQFEFVIKVAKPLSIAQSCHEYATMINVFPKGSCKHDFVKNMLNATGTELYSRNEIQNIREAHKIYTMSYSELFSSTSLQERLTTVNVVDNIVKNNCWFAFAMTKADGIPLSSLVEGKNNILMVDTLYRASLHRCLDIFVYKFLINLIQYGFCHGDAHLGNLFFSYPTKTLTIIDLGAVVRIDPFENNSINNKIFDIIIMSIYYNYSNILDVLSNLLNDKCTTADDNSDIIDLRSEKYIEFKKKLKKIRIDNIIHQCHDSNTIQEFKGKLFNSERVKYEEKLKVDQNPIPNIVTSFTNPYDYIDFNSNINKKTLQIIDNTGPIPFDINIQKSKILSFSYVMTLLLEFYASMNINIAIKFAEFYELLKAYKLFIDLLNQLEYPSQRFSVICNNLIFDEGNLKLLFKVRTIFNVFKTIIKEKSKFDKTFQKIKKFQANK